MSDRLKYELAEELGVADIVRREGWAGFLPGTAATWSAWPSSAPNAV